MPQEVMHFVKSQDCCHLQNSGSNIEMGVRTLAWQGISISNIGGDLSTKKVLAFPPSDPFHKLVDEYSSSCDFSFLSGFPTPPLPLGLAVQAGYLFSLLDAPFMSIGQKTTSSPHIISLQTFAIETTLAGKPS